MVHTNKSVLFSMRLPREHKDKFIEVARQSNRSLANFFVDSALAAVAEWKLQPKTRRGQNTEIAA